MIHRSLAVYSYIRTRGGMGRKERHTESAEGHRWLYYIEIWCTLLNQLNYTILYYTILNYYCSDSDSDSLPEPEVPVMTQGRITARGRIRYAKLLYFIVHYCIRTRGGIGRSGGTEITAGPR